MPSINFYLNRPFKKGSGKKHSTKTLNPNETMIFLYVTYPGRNIIKVSTGEKILAKDWSFERKNVKSAAPGSLSMNARLSYLKSEVLQAITLATTENPELTLPRVRQIVESVLDGKKPRFDKRNFIDYLNLFIEDIAREKKEGTVKKYATFKNVIVGYLEEKNMREKDFHFESIDFQWDLDFKDYLIKTRKNVNSTINKYYENLSVVMKWGLKRKFHKNTSFEEFNVTRRDNKDVVFLDIPEIDAIEALHLGGSEELVRDIFLFALYSGGQRIGDVMNVKSKDIQFNDERTEADWVLFQIKGKRTVRNILPLLSKALRIVKKYIGSNIGQDALIFPDVSEQHINRTIKDICDKAGINQHLRFLRYSGINPVEIEGPKSEFITFHSARRSFVSIAMKLGMPAELITRYTGHTSTKIMDKHYLGVSSEFKREALFKTWEKK
jgi:integrase